MERPKIIAHRGGVGGGPENTLVTFRRAIEAGVDGIECDVALTGDGQPVVLHIPFYSDNLHSLTGQQINLGSARWSEIKGVGVSGQPIPHLDDLLELIEDTDVEWFLEPKRADIRLVDAIVDAVAKRRVTSKVRVLTFFSRRELLLHAKKRNPEIKTAVITLMPWRGLARLARKAAADIIVPGWKIFNHLKPLSVWLDLEKEISEARATGLEVYSGIADNRENLAWLRHLGVDGVFTNQLQLARDVMKVE